ncbi:hypothetical protein ACFVZ3_42410, partial [Kitasatospora purpeofusca]
MTENTDATAGPEANRPPAGANWNTGGVQVVGSTVHGPVAGGQGATVRIGADAAPAAPVGPEALRAAAESRRPPRTPPRAETPGAQAATHAPEDGH